jgi:hypothetical protein
MQPYEENEVIIAAGEDSQNRSYLEITYTIPWRGGCLGRLQSATGGCPLRQSSGCDRTKSP